MSELYTRFDSVFFEKTRLSIMTLLMQEELLSFNQLKESLSLSDGSLYTHTEKLCKEGYVDKRKEVAGMQVQTVYAPSAKGRKQFGDYINFLESMLKQAGKRGRS